MSNNRAAAIVVTAMLFCICISDVAEDHYAYKTKELELKTTDALDRIEQLEAQIDKLDRTNKQ